MTAHEMLARVRTLPSLSPSALRLVSLLEQAEASNDEIVRAVREDGALTAKLLRACNSSALALKERVASVDQAVLLLGHRQIHQLVLSITLRTPMALPLSSRGLESNDLWHHSLLAAKAAELAAEGADIGVDISTAFTIGLLHDIGKLVTDQFLTRESMVTIRQQIAAGATRVAAERAVWGTDHAEVGAGLLYLWRLPDLLVEAVALHHQPAPDPKPRPATLASFANCAAHRVEAMEAVLQSQTLPGDTELFQAFGFSPRNLNDLLGRIRDISEKADLLTMP